MATVRVFGTPESRANQTAFWANYYPNQQRANAQFDLSAWASAQDNEARQRAMDDEAAAREERRQLAWAGLTSSEAINRNQQALEQQKIDIALRRFAPSELAYEEAERYAPVLTPDQIQENFGRTLPPSKINLLKAYAKAATEEREGKRSAVGGEAMQNFMKAAETGSIWSAGITPEQAKTTYNIPPAYHAQADTVLKSAEETIPTQQAALLNMNLDKARADQIARAAKYYGLPVDQLKPEQVEAASRLNAETISYISNKVGRKHPRVFYNQESGEYQVRDANVLQPPPSVVNLDGPLLRGFAPQADFSVPPMGVLAPPAVTASPFAEGQRVLNKRTGTYFIIRNGQPIPE